MEKIEGDCCGSRRYITDSAEKTRMVVKTKIKICAQRSKPVKNENLTKDFLNKDIDEDKVSDTIQKLSGSNKTNSKNCKKVYGDSLIKPSDKIDQTNISLSPFSSKKHIGIKNSKSVKSIKIIEKPKVQKQEIKRTIAKISDPSSIRRAKTFKISDYQGTIDRLSSRVKLSNRHDGNILNQIKNAQSRSGNSSKQPPYSSSNTNDVKEVVEVITRKNISIVKLLSTKREVELSSGSENITNLSNFPQNLASRLVSLSAIAKQTKSSKYLRKSKIQEGNFPLKSPSSFRLIEMHSPKADIEMSQGNADLSSSASAISEYCFR